ncbi:MAG: hypothetical protein CBARDMAM_2363 [uncultured Caballeronia sp.]|nr:MAG: hypothetical protein CBARDMAM_2363 [uncultured Caballeronia sp.]
MRGFIQQPSTSPDTAAIHIAAGFDIPTTAFFTTIAPDLRARLSALQACFLTGS